jgi:hypothetical protein
LIDFFQRADYDVITEGVGINVLAFHRTDPSRQQIRPA